MTHGHDYKIICLLINLFILSEAINEYPYHNFSNVYSMKLGAPSILGVFQNPTPVRRYPSIYTRSVYPGTLLAPGNQAQLYSFLCSSLILKREYYFSQRECFINT